MSQVDLDSALRQGKVDNYRSERGARAYFEDHRDKLHRRVSDRRERRILRRFLLGIPAGSILDIPSGYGRLLELLAFHGKEVVAADFSPTMLALNESLHGPAAEAYHEWSALDMPCGDRCFSTVVSVRLNHHLETPAHRERHIRELCRVADDAVILTFFSAHCLKNLLRRVRAPFDRKPPKNAMAPGRVREILADCGFSVEAMVPLSRLASGHVYVLARRGSDAGS